MRVKLGKFWYDFANMERYYTEEFLQEHDSLMQHYVVLYPIKGNPLILMQALADGRNRSCPAEIQEKWIIYLGNKFEKHLLE